jgi:hypothetical protein
MSDLELTMMRRVGELNKEVAALKAEVERLRSIGDEIIMDVYRSECLTDKWCNMARKWDAAKEGKPRA